MKSRAVGHTVMHDWIFKPVKGPIVQPGIGSIIDLFIHNGRVVGNERGRVVPAIERLTGVIIGKNRGVTKVGLAAIVGRRMPIIPANSSDKRFSWGSGTREVEEVDLRDDPIGSGNSRIKANSLNCSCPLAVSSCKICQRGRIESAIGGT